MKLNVSNLPEWVSNNNIINNNSNSENQFTVCQCWKSLKKHYAEANKAADYSTSSQLSSFPDLKKQKKKKNTHLEVIHHQIAGWRLTDGLRL